MRKVLVLILGAIFLAGLLAVPALAAKPDPGAECTAMGGTHDNKGTKKTSDDTCTVTSSSTVCTSEQIGNSNNYRYTITTTPTTTTYTWKNGKNGGWTESDSQQGTPTTEEGRTSGNAGDPCA